MRQTLYFLIFATFLITSCKDDEVPQTFLNGTYENVVQNTDTGIWYTTQYLFKSDGTYQHISLLRQSEEGATLGFTYSSEGTYILRGEEFSIRESKRAGINYEKYPNGYVSSLDELEDYEMDVWNSKGSLRQIDGDGQIGIVMECNDTIGSLLMCMGEMIYDKMD